MEQLYTPQELALAVRKIIENHPENWEQGVWCGIPAIGSTVDVIRSSMVDGACGSTACVAGWTAILAAPAGSVITVGSRRWAECLRLPNGAVTSIRNVAENALGLTYYEADFLFDSVRVKDEVIAILTAIENGFDWYSDEYHGELA